MALSGLQERSRSSLDWVFMGALAGLIAIGSLAVFSTVSPMLHYERVLARHFSALAAGLALFFLCWKVNYQVFEDQYPWIYAATLALLVLVLAVGTVQKGHKSWLRLGSFVFQPSEMARLALVLVSAAYLDHRRRTVSGLETALGAAGLALPMLGLILKQPDFSTALTFVPILAAVLYCAGADVRHLAGMGFYAALALGLPLGYAFLRVRYADAPSGSWASVLAATARLGWPSFGVLCAAALLGLILWWMSSSFRLGLHPYYFYVIPLLIAAGYFSGLYLNHGLKGYQRTRFESFLAPNRDVQGASYHALQARIAIGSGGLLGRGLFSGTQSRLGFLPERHTDFIFAAVGEEMGLAGASAVLGLYLLLIWRVVVAARSARDFYGYLVCCGLASMLGADLLLNVSMCMGLVPVAGIPLPLISYGGSSLVITLCGLGMVASVYSRRYLLS